MNKIVQLGIYGIWGIFLCLAGIEKFGDVFSVGSGLWSVVVLTLAGLSQIIAAVIAIGWAVLAFGPLRSKYLPYRFINNYTVPILIIGLAIVASAARSSSDEARAQKLGFKDGKEFSIARKNNITNVADYTKFAEVQRIKAAEKTGQDAAIEAEKVEQGKISKYAAIFVDTDKKYQVQELIKNDLKENSELTQKIIKEISSYDEHSVDRTVSELDYIDNGVSLKDYSFAIEHSDCRTTYKNAIFPIDEYYKAQWQMRKEQNKNTNWDMMPPIERKMFLFEGDRLTMASFKEKAPIQNKFNKCTFDLIKSIPHLSRPNATPRITPEYVPSNIKCVREKNGDVNMCY